MNRNIRIAVATLSLLAVSAVGSRAQHPGYFTLKLPEISADLAKNLSAVDLQITIVDAALKPSRIPSQLLRWHDPDKRGPKKPQWNDQKRQELTEVYLPIMVIEDLKVKGLQYRLDYKASFSDSGPVREYEKREYIPLSDSMTAELPFELVIVDTTGVKFAEGRTDGLRQIQWRVHQGDKKYSVGTAGPDRTVRDRILVEKGKPVIPEIGFTCAVGTRMNKVPWPGNEQDLRKTSLTVVLSQPECPDK